MARPEPAQSALPDGADQLDAAGFARVAALARREAGLAFPETKIAMVQSRLTRRLRATRHASFADYLDHVEGATGADERDHMISALTTNVSSFFREAHHFDTLRDKIAPILAERAAQGARIRLWSAGCSSGQEPYSIAMTLLDAAPDLARADLRILATDIDRSILARAIAGQFDPRQMADVPDAFRARYFSEAPDGEGWLAGPELRAMIAFQPLNLIADWPMHWGFDVIFCRNVVIYFDAATQAALWPRFAGALEPQGWLFLGHSERVQDASRWFTPAGITTYRRVALADADKGRSGHGPA